MELSYYRATKRGWMLYTILMNVKHCCAITITPDAVNNAKCTIVRTIAFYNTSRKKFRYNQNLIQQKRYITTYHESSYCHVTVLGPVAH